MIGQNRLTGTIDQSQSLLRFSPVHVLKTWDKNIENACLSVNNIFEKLFLDQPDWATKQVTIIQSQ